MSSRVYFIAQSKTLEGRESSPDRDLGRGRLLDADSKAKEEAGASQVDAAAAYTAKLKMMQARWKT